MTPAMLLSAALVFVGGVAQVAPPMTTQDEQRLLAVVGAARERVEFHGGRVRVFVIGPTIDEPAGAVLKRAVGAITQDEVPRDPAFKLLTGYFLLKSLRVTGDKATVSGTLGPVPAPREGGVLLACGTTFNIDVTKTPDGWVARVSSLSAC
jgi:hypothetical protein